MMREKLIEKIVAMPENEVRENLCEILYSYSCIGMVDHTQEKFIREVKRLYLKLAREGYKI